MNYHKELLNKIRSKKAKIGLIGVGYVGSALGVAASSRGFEVIGYSRTVRSKKKINELKISNFKGTNYIKDLSSSDIICICVPTPVNQNKSPDTKSLRDALKKTLSILKKGTLVVIESSVSPGMTRKNSIPILSKSGYKIDKEYFLSFSPERIDPGNEIFDFSRIPKIVSGYGDNSLELASEFYKNIVNEVHTVSSLETAEMSKILENTFRLVNISLINQISEYTKATGIDIFEVIEAASTKPFGFIPHYPGPGIGGHCIPVDPYYLLKDARSRGINLSIIEESGKVNDLQPEKVVNHIKTILKKFSNGSFKNRVLLIGVAYKKNIPDVRETPAKKIWELLEKDGMKVSYHDPYISNFKNTKSVPLTDETINNHDIISIITHHDNIEFSKLLEFDIPVLDTRDVIKKNDDPELLAPNYSSKSSQKVYRLFQDVI